MKVEQLMQRAVRTCRPEETLNDAAKAMWEADCGCLPVVDGEGALVGVITDRDVCMAAYTQGLPLGALPVAGAMAHEPRTCRPADTIAEAESIMRAAQVRRLPVVDPDNRVVGILSLNDLALQATRERGGKRKRQVRDDELAATLGAICVHRAAGGVSTAA